MIKKFLSLILIAGLLVSSVAPSSALYWDCKCNKEKREIKWLTQIINQCKNMNKIWQTNVTDSQEDVEKSQLKVTYYKTKYEDSQGELAQCENEILSNSRFFYWVAGKCIGMATFVGEKIFNAYCPVAFPFFMLIKHFLPIVVGAGVGEIIYKAAHHAIA